MTIRVNQIRTTHQHQPVDNGIHPLVDVAVPPFFKGPDIVGPQSIVEVDLIEGIFVPLDRIEGAIGTTAPGTIVQRPTNNLEGLINQQSIQ